MINSKPTSSVLYRSPTIFAPFTHLITAESTRHGGVSPAPYNSLNLGVSTADSPENILENQARLWGTLGIPPQQVASSHQVHGAEVLVVTEPGRYEGFDALITNKKGILLSVTVADCTPILLFDPKNQAIAAIHAGWRGTVQEIASKTLLKMKTEYGTDPLDCYAYIGTCIDNCSFEVGDEVAEQFGSLHKHFNSSVGKYFVDLKKANHDQLTKVGIPRVNIQISTYSTVTNNQDYFSFRHEKGLTGRFLACICLKTSNLHNISLK